MRAALIIAARDLRAGIRDRTVIIMAVIAPFALAAIFSFVIPSGDDDLDLQFAYADLDGSQISEPFRDVLASLEDAGVASVTELDDADAARQAVDAEEAGAAIIVPAGFGTAVQAGEAAQIEVIGNVGAGTSSLVARAAADAYAAELESIRLAVATVEHAGGVTDPAELARIAAAAAAAEAPIALSTADVELRRMDNRTFYAAAMAIFFLFFTAQFGALSLLTERRQGTLPRLVAAPIRPADIILGKALGSFVIGIVAMAILVVASTFLLGAQWGAPVAVAILVLAAVIAAMGLTAMVTTFARTEEQAGGWNAVLATTLAILGGAFFPVAQGPEILRTVSLATPHAWFLRGLDDLSLPTAGLTDIWPSLLALVAIGVVAGAIGLARAGRLVVAR